MASTDVVLFAAPPTPPTTSAPSPVTILGGSAPVERWYVWQFTDTQGTAYLDFDCVLEGYDGGGLDLVIEHGCTSGTPGNNVRISAAIRRNQDDTDVITASHTYDYNAATIATPSAVNELARDVIQFTNGADMDNLADGETCRVRIRREPADAADNLGGNWFVKAIWARET
jgi:hypothetical protein